MRALPLLLALACAPAWGQGFEAALLGGYTTRGGLEPVAAGVTDLELEGSLTWGASLGWSLSPKLGVEASWTRQDSALVIGTDRGQAELFDVSVDRLQASLVWQLGGEQARLRPFVSAGLGAAFLGAPDLDGETKLAFNLGAGLKWLPTRRFGARLQARYVPAYLNDAGSDYCDPFGFCQSWLHQFELTGGVLVRF